MGLDPITIGLGATLLGGPLAGAVAGGGALAYGLMNKKKDRKAPPAPVAPTRVESQENTGRSRDKKYRPAAQVFKDEDFRLGMAGKLGG